MDWPTGGREPGSDSEPSSVGTASPEPAPGFRFSLAEMLTLVVAAAVVLAVVRFIQADMLKPLVLCLTVAAPSAAFGLGRLFAPREALKRLAIYAAALILCAVMLAPMFELGTRVGDTKAALVGSLGCSAVFWGPQLFFVGLFEWCQWEQARVERSWRAEDRLRAGLPPGGADSEAKD